MDSENSYSPQASFLGLPPELRLRIYAAAYSDELVVELHGRGDGAPHISKTVTGALLLTKICHLVRQEALPLQPSVSEIRFGFYDFTLDDAKVWLANIGDDNLSEIRKLGITCYGGCYRGGPYYKNRHAHGYAFITSDEKHPCNWDCEKLHTNTLHMAKISHGLCRRTTKINLNNIPFHLSEDPPKNYFDKWAKTDFCEGSLRGCQMTQRPCVRHELGNSHFRLLDKGQHSATLTREKLLRLFRDMLDDRSGTHAEEDWRRCVEDGTAGRIAEEERMRNGLPAAVKREPLFVRESSS